MTVFEDLPQDLRVLDFYAGECKWITPRLRRFDSVALWEIRPDFKARLEKCLPNGVVTIGDSYQMAQLPENRHRFNLVVMDNHVGSFADKVEHFEALPHVMNLLDEKGGYLVVNLCTDPEFLLVYNYIRNFRALWENTRTYWRKIRDGTFKRWLSGRLAFYGCESISQHEAERTYIRYFANLGVMVEEFTWEERRPFLYLLRMRLTPVER